MIPRLRRWDVTEAKTDSFRSNFLSMGCRALGSSVGLGGGDPNSPVVGVEEMAQVISAGQERNDRSGVRSLSAEGAAW